VRLDGKDDAEGEAADEANQVDEGKLPEQLGAFLGAEKNVRTFKTVLSFKPQSLHIERANIHSQSIASTRSFYMGLHQLKGK
jgi:hypothetical protein